MANPKKNWSKKITKTENLSKKEFAETARQRLPKKKKTNPRTLLEVISCDIMKYRVTQYHVGVDPCGTRADT